MKRNILTYTGTLGLLTYENKEKESIELYLWNKKQRGSEVTKGIPVPQYYYKIVYDEQANKGVAFLGLNDPYSEDLKSSDLLCTNICDKIEWFKEEVKKYQQEEYGHITCCDIQDFAENVVENVNDFKTDAGQNILDEMKTLNGDDALLGCRLECKEKDLEEMTDEEIKECKMKLCANYVSN